MKHGHLTVTREVGLNKYRQTEYECQCECGGSVIMRTAHFTPARQFCTRSCVLLREHRAHDLAGRRFNRWRVISYGGRGYKNRIAWNCVCDCGTERVVETWPLVNGDSQSCGCLCVDTNSKGYTPEQKVELHRQRCRESNRKNRSRVKANKIRYEARLKRATPCWLTREDWDYMNAMYDHAVLLTKETGVKHQVDHIVPLNGRLITGLHVPGNLQILTQAENVAKSNRYAELSGD